MKRRIERRHFLQLAALGCATCVQGGRALAYTAPTNTTMLVSPGCRKSKVRIARVYLSVPGARWPDPRIDLNSEIRRYEAEFKRLKNHFADVDFVVDETVSRREQARDIAAGLKNVDGILALHLTLGAADLLAELLKSLRPTVLFASPTSRSDWSRLAPLRNEDGGSLLDFILTSDVSQLAAVIRPFRAIHHLKEAKIINVSAEAPPQPYIDALRNKFGTEVSTMGLAPVREAYDSITTAEAEEEAEHWVNEAECVFESRRDEILRSCKLALAFEKLLGTEQATVLTIDCRGSMYRRLPASPCTGFVRLNNLGLGGVCESDLGSAITHIALQGLSGKPGSVFDPLPGDAGAGTIRANCLGNMKMDGPASDAAPYILRTIEEPREGCVPQVRWRLGQSMTQARLTDENTLSYFTGRIVDAPEADKGCRSRITLEIDGDPAKLGQNWVKGARRTAVYGDITQDLKRFCRFKELRLVNEA